MVSAVFPQADFLERVFPYWFAPIPEGDSEDVQGDWVNVTLTKRDSFGNIIVTDKGEPVFFHFQMECSTGDLYGIQDGEEKIKAPFVISLKAMGMFFATSSYSIGMMAACLFRIAGTLSSVFWRVIPQCMDNLSKKGVFSSLGNAAMATCIEIPMEVSKDIWRIARIPLYGNAMMAAALFAMVFPLEGRKWLAKIELEWHEGVPYSMHVCYKKSKEDWDKMPFSEFCLALREGKIFYLGYCMQKRGNIKEEVVGKPRFEFYEERKL